MKVVIALLTFRRTQYAVATIKAMRRHFKCDNYAWYVADGGSNAEHMQAIASALTGEPLLGHHSILESSGAMQNRTVREVLKATDILFFLEDDWVLNRELDVRPYLTLLRDTPELGMVRFGYLGVGSDVRIEGYSGAYYLRFLRSTQYAYVGGPSLRHRRFVEAYGMFLENVTAGQVEVDYDGRLRMTTGPEIVFPFAGAAGWGWFDHIGQKRAGEFT